MEHTVSAEALPSGPFKLFGRPSPLIDFMISMFLDNISLQEETSDIASSKFFKEQEQCFSWIEKILVIDCRPTRNLAVSINSVMILIEPTLQSQIYTTLSNSMAILVTS